MAENPWQLPEGYDESVAEALRQVLQSLRNAKKFIPKAAYEALRVGDLTSFYNLIDFDGIANQLEPLKNIFEQAARTSALELYKKGGVGAKLTFDLIDERAVYYASSQVGTLITNITEEMRNMIRGTIASSTMGDMTVAGAARELVTYIPLTDRDANAVRKYAENRFERFIKQGMSDTQARQKADKLRDAYADKLLRKRATTIARTEVARAASEGRYLGWEAGVESGLIDNTSVKEWIAEPDACPICAEMDGKTVKWDDTFEFGGMMPPAHPNCRCASAILPPDLADTVFTSQAIRKTFGNQFEIEFAKHLEGKHDQSTHGHHGVAYTLPSKREAPNLSIYSEVSSTKPYVGLSEKAQAIASQIGATYGHDDNGTYAWNGSDWDTKADVSYADWTNSKGETYKLALYRKVNQREDSTGTSIETYRVKAPDIEVEIFDSKGESKGGLGALSFWTGPSSGSMETFTADFYYAISGVSSEVKGSATAMLEFARREADYPIFHNSDLTAQGRKFARTTKSVEKAEESFKPTIGMVAAAKRALRWKEQGKATGAGTPVGWGRATDIVSGRTMSFDVVQRMYSFFSRHEVDKKGKNFNNMSDPSNGRIMWDAWGGDAGFGWSRNIVERHKRMEKHLTGQHDQSTHGKSKAITVGNLKVKEAIFSKLPEHDWSYESIYAVRAYSGNPQGFLMNKQLREGKVSKESKRLMETIDKAPRLDQDTMFLRYTGDEAFKKLGSKPDASWIGKTVTEKGFTSVTSVYKKNSKDPYVHMFSDKEPIAVKIIAPKGTKGIIANEYEAEYIIQAKTSYTITDVQNTGGKNVITMVVTDQ